MSRPGKTSPSDELIVSELEEYGAVALLHLGGRLDAKAAQGLQQRCAAIRKQGKSHLTLELSQVTFVSSSGLGVFLALTEEFKEAGGSFHLLSPSPTVSAVIKLLNLHRFLSIAAKLEEITASVAT